jgi:ABC-type uncharacterized transport system substrate-binding protein
LRRAYQPIKVLPFKNGKTLIDFLVFMKMKNPVYFFIFLTFALVTCSAVNHRYILRTKYIVLPDMEHPAMVEIAEGIEEFFNANGFQTIYKPQGYAPDFIAIETEWRNVSSIEDTLMALIGILSAFTTDNNGGHTTTYIKYYVSVYENHYTIRAVKRVITDKENVYEQTVNDIVEVVPNSELWKQMEILVQKMNVQNNIIRYDLITGREIYE